jgi:2-hydroxychromene-2-carboxylate isomerase
MREDLTYYFSTGSRYSYLSMSQVPDIEQRYGVRFNWVPVNGKRIRALRGADPFQGPPQSGQYDWTYRERDAKAWATYYGIEFNEPTDVEFDVELLLRAVIAAGQQGDIRSYAWQLAREVFANGKWPLDNSVVEAVARDMDLNMDAFSEACSSPQIQQELEANCAEAVQRGAFGTPSLFVADELFWGNDRLALLRHRLHQDQLQARGDHQFEVVALDHVVLRSADPEGLVAFYQKLLHAPVERQVGDFLWQLRVGDSLLDILRTKDAPTGANMDHFCLRVTPFDEAGIMSLLAKLGIDTDNTAGRIYGAQGFGPSIYFIDPAGNRVELKQHKS